MTLELGTTSLAEARLARGLTLEDAERGTRISRKFLIALETHDYSVFPAPVYARGFLRTYCRYLGVDPEPQLAELPAGWTTTPQATPLPPVSHGPISINFAWVIAGAVIAAIIGLGFMVSRGGDDLPNLQPPAQELASGEQPQTAPDEGVVASSEPPSQPATASESPAARPLDPGTQGVLPNFVGVAAPDVEAFLESQGIAYLRIDTRSSVTASGIVLAQMPEEGTATAQVEQVTLTVSSGDASPPARTDCGVLAESNQRTAAEQAFFEDNCSTAPQAPPDRTTCEEIRGTDYRSPAEREFFLANCIIQ